MNKFWRMLVRCLSRRGRDCMLFMREGHSAMILAEHSEVRRNLSTFLVILMLS